MYIQRIDFVQWITKVLALHNLTISSTSYAHLVEEVDGRRVREPQDRSDPSPMAKAPSVRENSSWTMVQDCTPLTHHARAGVLTEQRVQSKELQIEVLAKGVELDL